MNVIEVEVVKAVRAPVRPGFVRSVAGAALKLPELAARLRPGTTTVAFRITGDEEMSRLNLAFAAEDHTTDVLSFAGDDAHLGDVAISWPAVVRQAREYRETAETELALLCVHGLLHLAGWDHATAAQHREMTRLTLAALALSGLRPAARRL